MAKATIGGMEVRRFKRLSSLLDQLLEGFEQLQECVGVFFADWQKKLEMAATSPEGVAPCPPKAGMAGGWEGLDPSGLQSSPPPDQKEVSSLHFLPPESPAFAASGGGENLRPLAHWFLGSPCPEGTPSTLLVDYLVKHLQRLEQQREALQTHCRQLEIQLAEKTHQLAHLTHLLEQHQCQLLHYRQQWVEQLHLLKPWLDYLFTAIAECPDDGERMSCAEELPNKAAGQATPILSLSALRDRKISTG